MAWRHYATAPYRQTVNTDGVRNAAFDGGFVGAAGAGSRPYQRHRARRSGLSMRDYERMQWRLIRGRVPDDPISLPLFLVSVCGWNLYASKRAAERLAAPP